MPRATAAGLDPNTIVEIIAIAVLGLCNRDASRARMLRTSAALGVARSPGSVSDEHRAVNPL